MALKIYKVRFHYHTHADVVLVAHDEKEAIANAEDIVSLDDYDVELLNNLIEDSEPELLDPDEEEVERLTKTTHL